MGVTKYLAYCFVVPPAAVVAVPIVEIVVLVVIRDAVGGRWRSLQHVADDDSPLLQQCYDSYSLLPL